MSDSLYEVGQHVRVKQNICENDTTHCGWIDTFKNYTGHIVEIAKSAQIGNFNAYEVRDLKGSLIELTFENDCFEEGVVAKNVTYTVECLEVVQGAVFKVSKKKKSVFRTEKEACDFILSIASQEKKYKNIIMSMDKDISTIPATPVPPTLPPSDSWGFEIPQQEEDEDNPCDGCNGDDCDDCEYGNENGDNSPCDTNCEADCEGCRYN